MSFKGVSIFLWQLANMLNNQAEEDAAMDQFCGSLREGGLSAVYVKVADGAVPYNLQRKSQNQWDDNALLALMEKLSAQQLHKIGWQYLYGREPEKEADRALERINRLGLQGYILDAEQEYKTAGASAAEKFMKRLRAGSELPVALCSYRFPSLHREFPWQAFLSWMDAEQGDCHMPQVYWVGDSRSQGPGLQLQRSIKELQQLKGLPVLPIGGLYAQEVNGSRWQPSRAQMQNFASTAQAQDCPGVGWWSWDSLAHLDGVPGTDNSKLGWWTEVKHTTSLFHSIVNPGSALSLEERVMALEAQARRHGWQIQGGE